MQIQKSWKDSRNFPQKIRAYPRPYSVSIDQCAINKQYADVWRAILRSIMGAAKLKMNRPIIVHNMTGDFIL